MTRAEAVERIIGAIRATPDGMTHCDVCALRFATTPLAHAGIHRKQRGFTFWSHHSAFLGVVPVAPNAPTYLRNGGRVEDWFLRNPARALRAGWAVRTEKTLLVPLPLWEYLHDMTRRHRRAETTAALLDDMIAEALKGDAP